MREMTIREQATVGGGYNSPGGSAADAILTASGAFLGFCLGGGPTPAGVAGAFLGAEAGHALALILID